MSYFKSCLFWPIVGDKQKRSNKKMKLFFPLFIVVFLSLSIYTSLRQDICVVFSLPKVMGTYDRKLNNPANRTWLILIECYSVHTQRAAGFLGVFGEALRRIIIFANHFSAFWSNLWCFGCYLSLCYCFFPCHMITKILYQPKRLGFAHGRML